MTNVESVLRMFGDYDMNLTERFECYQENLRCIQDVSDKLLSFMKGHSASFRSAITDRKWNFSHEKLKTLVEEMLSRWAAKQRDGTFTDPSTGESLAEPYIQARQELYRNYLYITMRCSVCQGAYALVTGSETMEETNFAFLLANAKTMWQSWCVMEMPDGSKESQPFFGFDWMFGFHFYRIVSRPESGYDNLLDTDYLPLGLPVDRPADLTDEGNVKRLDLKRIFGETPPGLTKESAHPEEADAAEDGMDDYRDEDYDNFYAEYGYAFEEDDIEVICAPNQNILFDIDPEAKYDEGEQWAQRQCTLEHLASNFDHPAEYITACESFVKLFRDAKPEVLRGFYAEIEEIIALHLVELFIPPLTNENKVRIVHDSICDGPYKQAERYARSVQLKYL